MNANCVMGNHDDCPDTMEDSYACSCPCHMASDNQSRWWDSERCHQCSKHLYAELGSGCDCYPDIETTVSMFAWLMESVPDVAEFIKLCELSDMSTGGL